MEELKILIKKLLNNPPKSVGQVYYDCDKVAKYVSGDIQYEIRIENSDNEFMVALFIYQIDLYLYLNSFKVELTEKEYMETKWTIEEWDKYLKNKQLNEFYEFVESLSTKSMDELLN